MVSTGKTAQLLHCNYHTNKFIDVISSKTMALQFKNNIQLLFHLLYIKINQPDQDNPIGWNKKNEKELLKPHNEEKGEFKNSKEDTEMKEESVNHL